jgi:penicillin amidase
MIPHIFADNMEDAVMVQGYLTARDRLWQMDLTVRKASGRLSEVLGERTLQTDRITRRRGMGMAAQNSVAAWRKSPESMKLLEAYTAGVNAWTNSLKPADYPLEFKLLNYKPEPWSVLKTAFVIEGMSEMLASREDDLEATNALEAFGRATFDSLYPLWNPRQKPIIPDTGQWKGMITLPAPGATTPGNSDGVGFRNPLPAPPTDFFEIPDPENAIDRYRVGSNNWAVDGQRTLSKKPILANDPHLSLNLPSIWYQAQIHTPDQNTCGVSLPGVPGIVIGFNDYIAWGLTNVGMDVTDWYQIQWTDDTRSQYKLDQQVSTTRVEIEKIGILGKPDLIDTVRYTVWGPVVYDYDKQHPLHDCALRWISHDAPDGGLIEAFAQLGRAKNYNDYRTSISGFDVPAQNFVFASRTGDIGITVQGRFPVRAVNQGRFIQDGSRWENNWQNFIPTDQIPAMKNPSRGFVFSANQHSTPPTYPYFYFANFEANRSRRIYNRLEALQQANLDSMKTIQLDNFSQRAADALPLMLKMLNRNELDADGAALARDLDAWNYRYEANLTAPAHFVVWLDSLHTQTWDEMNNIPNQRPIMKPELWRLIEMLESDTLNRFFDVASTPTRETARQVVNSAFHSMQQYFRANPTRSTKWGEFRGLSINHLARIPAFSRTGLLTGGDRSAPNAISNSHGPSWRMIVQPGDSLQAIGVYPGGQSGNPGSKYYDNMLDKWVNGEYYDLVFLHRADEASPRIVKRHTFVGKQ